MPKSKLALEIERLVIPKDLETTKEWFDLHLDSLIHISQKHRDNYTNDYQLQARIVMHMIFSKALSINKLLEGISYSKEGIKLNKIIDPTAIAVLVRNIFETVTVFNICYRFHSDPKESEIIYNLWVLSGLKYRQRFRSATSTTLSQDKLNEELQTINAIENEIRTNSIYLGLPERQQGKLETCMADRKFQVTIENNQVKMLAWHQLIEKVGFGRTYHDQIYNYLSLYAHPSNVSVFQFSQMFDKTTEDYKGMTSFNLQLAIWLISTFIADYLNFFPEALKYFEEQNDLTQIAVNQSNKAIRGVEYSINNKWRLIEA